MTLKSRRRISGGVVIMLVLIGSISGCRRSTPTRSERRSTEWQRISYDYALRCTVHTALGISIISRRCRLRELPSGSALEWVGLVENRETLPLLSLSVSCTAYGANGQPLGRYEGTLPRSVVGLAPGYGAQLRCDQGPILRQPARRVEITVSHRRRARKLWEAPHKLPVKLERPTPGVRIGVSALGCGFVAHQGDRGAFSCGLLVENVGEQPVTLQSVTVVLRDRAGHIVARVPAGPRLTVPLMPGDRVTLGAARVTPAYAHVGVTLGYRLARLDIVRRLGRILWPALFIPRPS